MNAPAELAQRTLGLVGDGADGVQVSVQRERSLLSRFARSEPTQATAIDDTTVHVLALVDGHTGAAETNDLSTEGLRDSSGRAIAAARAARLAAGAPGEYPGLPTAATPPSHDGFDLGTAEPSADLAGSALDEAFATCAEHGCEAFGVWTAGRVTTAIASSTGLLVSDDVTDAFVKVIARDPDTGRSGWGASCAVGVHALDARAAAQRAAGAVGSDTPRDVAPGAYPVVLAPDAVGILLEFLGMVAFNGLAHAEGRGALVGRLGTAVAAPAITITDAPQAPGTLPRGFDAEGVPKAPLTLIDAGAARAIAHDTASAALAGDGARSTGHAVAPGGSPWGPATTNLVLDGGAAASEEELIAPIERGLYVTRLWYVNVVHERSALLTGMTRDGTFWIEDGKLAAPARDVRFTDSPLRILEATQALTSAQRLVSEAEFYGPRFASGVVCPALRADGFVVTGATPA